jgi:hypothetical protein
MGTRETIQMKYADNLSHDRRNESEVEVGEEQWQNQYMSSEAYQETDSRQLEPAVNVSRTPQ